MKPVFWNSPPSPLWHDGKSWFLDIHDKRIKTTDHLPVACGTRRPLDFEPAVEPFVRRMTAEGRRLCKNVQLLLCHSRVAFTIAIGSF